MERMEKNGVEVLPKNVVAALRYSLRFRSCPGEYSLLLLSKHELALRYSLRFDISSFWASYNLLGLSSGVI